MTAPTRMCRRCGIVNRVQPTRLDDGTPYLCESCKVYWPENGHTTPPCRRCGKRRRADNPHDTLCGHCSREPEHLSILADGQWVRDGLVMRWKANPPRDNGCGTETGYHTHRRRAETPCDECREAHRIYRAKKRAEKKEVA